jgi:hypothetical protein
MGAGASLCCANVPSGEAVSIPSRWGRVSYAGLLRHIQVGDILLYRTDSALKVSVLP